MGKPPLTGKKIGYMAVRRAAHRAAKVAESKKTRAYIKGGAGDAADTVEDDPEILLA